MTDEDIDARAAVKAREVERIFQAMKFSPQTKPVRVAVLGCADRRMVGLHREMFEASLGKSVDMTTFDITVAHLAGEKGIVQHDVTQPLPGGPYDVVYSHVLLKFIETEKQWDVILHSYEALRPPGLAIHVCDFSDVGGEEKTMPEGLYSIPIGRWEKALDGKHIRHHDAAWENTAPNGVRVRGLALIISK